MTLPASYDTWRTTPSDALRADEDADDFVWMEVEYRVKNSKGIEVVAAATDAKVFITAVGYGDFDVTNILIADVHNEFHEPSPEEFERLRAQALEDADVIAAGRALWMTC